MSGSWRRPVRPTGQTQPGVPWGPFTLRVPLYHTCVQWPELLQGLLVAGATGLALVPFLMGPFELSFEEAVACVFIQAVLLSSTPILFGEPYAPGWITPALPLALAFVLAQHDGVDVYATPSEKFQIMTAVSLDFSLLVFVLGITGNEILRAAMPDRPDERLDINMNRSHMAMSIRNLLMGLLAPFFPTQGCLWTGVHVIVVQRWREGRQVMDSLFGGIASYYVFGIPLLYLVRPLVTGLKPMMGIALSLTLVLTGFACAYVAMGIPRTQIERGVTVLTAVALAIFSPWVGMAIGIAAVLLLVGIRSPDLSASGS